MSTQIARQERTRFHADPLFFDVTEADCKPRSAKHAARMTEAQKKEMDRKTAQLKQLQAAVAAKAKSDIAIAKEVSDRAIVAEQGRVAAVEKNAADKAAAAKSGKLFQEPETRLLLVIRIKGTNQMPPKPKKALALLRLLQINSAVFVKTNKATMSMLNICRPWITYGVPSPETVRSLIYKRGVVRTGIMGSYTNVRLQSNDLVERYLGQHGIKGVEDLVTEIADVGANFTQANRTLAPFRLNNPNGGFKKSKKHQFTEMRGGEAGDRSHFINDLVRRMI